jgi:hypothetical protein
LARSAFRRLGGGRRFDGVAGGELDYFDEVAGAGDALDGGETVTVV